MSKKITDKINDFVDKNIITQDIDVIISERFGRYSKYIIQDRALPDVRDGLKPVQRRILYGMHQMGIASNKPYKKSARIVGEVMGKYHPHGDSSIYDAMARMAQEFKMLVTLVDMHGNKGSIDGDSPAAMRYTEARLSKASEYLLEDLDKRTVPFVPNFDDEELEPVVLPAKFPNLLVNGSMGISAGYATKIPPHNLEEVIQATIAYLKNPNLTTKEAMKYVKGPDFPTGGIVQGLVGIKEALETGAGKIIIRSKVFVEEISKTQDRIVVTEIPYEVNKSNLVKTIDLLRINKTLEDILEVRDETDQEGLRIAIDLKKGADPNIVLAYLLKNTELQISYNYNMIAIVNRKPEQVGLIQILKAYVEHQKEVITNRSNFLLEKAQKREHIVLGLIKMVSILDEVIHTIRNSNNKADAKQQIQNKFSFSELQSEAIVTLQLYRLSNTDITDLQNEYNSLKNQIKDLEIILTNETALINVIEQELKKTAKDLREDRKTQLEAEIDIIRIDEKELISEEKVMIGITKEGYVVRSNLRSYSTTKTPGLKADDSFLFEKEVNTLDTLLIFTSLGNYIFYPVYKLEDQKWGDLGIYINNIVSIEKDETIVKVYAITNFDTNQTLLLATKSGMMKQINLKDLEVSRYSKSIRAMRIKPDDKLVSVDFDEKENILAMTKNGYALRFLTIDLPLYGLQAAGVRGMLLANDDELVYSIYANQEDDFYFLTSRGHAIKDSISLLPLYNRARRGVSILERLKSNPHYVKSVQRVTKNQANEDSEVLVITDNNHFKFRVSDLKYSSNKFGKKLYDETIYGEAYYFEITPSFTDEIMIKKPTKTKVNKEIVEIKTIPEIIETKDNKKIKLNRLDLFDDN
jgi:topoisomerase-4 subunit A